ncbi:uncharacterized protein LOC128198269 [Bicyclus anynana]|uniref:Uncharacterized protein LOC128198269 n=1 Tax=Bicyclus anynana TaxID=110368 RepID=A0ABM3LHQ0_BICAN|nr:uncharacterized protein LOC128198269 [Bicyclus anynana]
MAAQTREITIAVTKNVSESINEKLSTLIEENKNLKLQVQSLDDKIKLMDEQKRRNNIIFFGIKEEQHRESPMETIINLLGKNMNIHINSTEINNAYRLGKKENNTPRPILVTFTTFWRRNEVLKNKKKLGLGTYVKEDLSKETLEMRKQLLPQLKEERAKGNICYFVKDKIVTKEPKEDKIDKRKRYRSDSPEKLPMEPTTLHSTRQIRVIVTTFKPKKHPIDTGNRKTKHKNKNYLPNETTNTPRRLVTAGESDHYPPNITPKRQTNTLKDKKQQNNKNIHIATYNTLSLRSEENLQELIYSLQDIKWDIIGLSEVRRNGEAIVEYGQFILYYKGETPGRHGVGFLIKKELKNLIIEMIGISERIAILNTKIPSSKEVWSIVQIYSPTEQSTKTEIDTFYSSLNIAIKEHTHKNCIIMGDFNAQVGTPRNGEDIVLGPYSYGKRTRNGQKLMEMAFENNMTILNSQFKKRTSRRWTWISPDGRYKNEIDYFLTNKPNLFEDCGTITNLNFNSNHRMIRARLNAPLAKKRRPFKVKPAMPNNKARIAVIETNLNSVTEASLQYLTTQEKYNILHEILTERPENTESKPKDKGHISKKNIRTPKPEVRPN